MKPWYEELFQNYGKSYDNEVFTTGTTGECDFIEQELNYDKSLRLLDIGCGTGRHAIELTKRGYHITGVDLSDTLGRFTGAEARRQTHLYHAEWPVPAVSLREGVPREP